MAAVRIILKHWQMALKMVTAKLILGVLDYMYYQLAQKLVNVMLLSCFNPLKKTLNHQFYFYPILSIGLR